MPTPVGTISGLASSLVSSRDAPLAEDVHPSAMAGKRGRRCVECRAVERQELVFLAGLHRSGTTLLARLLAAHPEISGFSGTGVPADEGQHLQSVYPPASVYGGPGRFGFAANSHLTEADVRVSEHTARTLFEDWSPHWDLSRRLLLEKSPPNLLKTRFLQALFPGSAFVVVLRHPIAVSLATAKWQRMRPYHRLLVHWLRCYELFAADRERLERVHLVRYEQFVCEPEQVLRGIFDFLGVDPVPPSETVQPDADDRYFARWRALKRAPLMGAYLDLASLWYERRVRRFGYSLFFPEGEAMNSFPDACRGCVGHTRA